MSKKRFFDCRISALSTKHLLAMAAGWLLVFSSDSAAFAISEAEEEAQASKLHSFINEAIVYPSNEAQNQGQLERALALHQRAIAEWGKEQYHFKWAQDLQTGQICGNLRAEADILKALGRYEEAARVYLQVDEKNAKWSPRANRSCALDAGRTYLEGRMYDRAKQIFDEILQSAEIGDKLEAHVELSKMYTAEGNPKKAESELTDLLTDKHYGASPYMVRALRVNLKALYLRLNKKYEADKIEALLQDRHCPRCGSDKNVERIGYGLIHGTAVGFHPGGCVSMPYSASWWCKTDGLAF